MAMATSMIVSNKSFQIISSNILLQQNYYLFEFCKQTAVLKVLKTTGINSLKFGNSLHLFLVALFTGCFLCAGNRELFAEFETYYGGGYGCIERFRGRGQGRGYGEFTGYIGLHLLGDAV